MSIQELRATLGAATIEREREIDLLLTGLVAGEHTLLVGPPGVAKSYLCRSLAAGVEGMTYAEVALTGADAPEDLFGPPDLGAIRTEWRHLGGAGTVQGAQYLFVDEVFRGSSVAHNCMLGLLGPERAVRAGTEWVRCPLLASVGASNTWADDASQSAFQDRWLIRHQVRPVSPQGRERLAFEDLPEVAPVCSVADIEAAQTLARAIPIGDAARAAFRSILGELAEAGIIPSDRRVRQSIGVARAAAVIDGAAEVAPGHLEVLGSVLWDQPDEQPAKSQEIVSRIANPVGAEITALLADVDDVVGAARDSASRMSAVKKLEECEARAGQLAEVAHGNGRAGRATEYIRRERVRVQAAMLGVDPDRAAALLGGGS